MANLFSLDTLLRLCELTRGCPEDHASVRSTRCKTCGYWHADDPGRIPLLDPALVRVQCLMPGTHRPCIRTGYPTELISREEHKKLQGRCPTCLGYGYTPSLDPWAYVQAAWPLFAREYSDWQDRILSAIGLAMDRTQDPGSAALALVAEALLEVNTNSSS